jgi:AAA ATPase domain
MSKKANSAESLHTRIQFLGNPCLIFSTGQRLPLSQKEAALLLLPVVAAPLSSKQLGTILNPVPVGGDPSRNLRQTVWALKKKACCKTIELVRDGAVILLLSHDLDPPDHLWQSDPQALPGELLGTFDYSNNSDLNVLIADARNRWRATRDAALSKVASAHEASRRFDEALPYRQRLCNEDPVEQDRHVDLIRLHLLRADHLKAQAVHSAICERLRDNRQVSPGLALNVLAGEIRNSASKHVLVPRRIPLEFLRPTLTVGRDELLRSLEIARSGCRHAVLTGPAGIGKTHLLDQVSKGDRSVLVVRLWPSDLNDPRSWQVRIARALVQARAANSKWGAGEKAWLARLLPELGVPAPGQDDAARTAQALLACAKAAHASCLILDDFHYAGSAAIKVLAELLTATDGPWWLLSSRSDVLPDSLLQWLNAAGANTLQRIELPSLSLDDFKVLLRHLKLPARAITPEFVQTLYERCGGSPLFALETLRSFWEGGVLKIPTSDQWPTPTLISTLMRSRMQKLATEQLQLAQVAALADNDLDAELASAVLGIPLLALAPAWQALEAAHILIDSKLTLDLLREAVLGDLPKAVAQALHARIAAHLEVRSGAQAAERAALHWRVAEHWKESACAYRRAALIHRASYRRNDELGAWHEALGMFERCWDRAAVLETKAELVEVTLLLHGPIPALHLTAAVLASQPGLRPLALAKLGRLKALMLQGDFKDARSWAVSALPDITACRDQHLSLVAEMFAVQAIAQTGDAKAAMTRLDGLQESVQALASDEVSYEFWAAKSYVNHLQQQPLRELDLLTNALEMARRLGDPLEQMTMLSNRSLTLYEMGRTKRAYADAREAHQFRSEFENGNSIHAGAGALHLGAIALAAGRLGESLHMLELARQTLEISKGMAHLPAACAQLASLYLQLGMQGKVRALLSGDWSSAHAPHRRFRLILLLRMARANGDPTQALLAELRGEATVTTEPHAQAQVATETAWASSESHAIAELRDARSTLQQLGRLALAQAAHASLVMRLLESGQTKAALVEALGCWAAAATCNANSDQLFVLRVCAQVFRKTEEWDAHAQVLTEFKQWMSLAERAPLPAALAESLRTRNPDVLALLAEKDIPQRRR